MTKTSFTRRNMLIGSAAFLAAGGAALADGKSPTMSQAKVRIVIIGGGFGGATGKSVV